GSSLVLLKWRTCIRTSSVPAMGRDPLAPMSAIAPTRLVCPGPAPGSMMERNHFMSVLWWRRGGGAGWGWMALVPFVVVCLTGVAVAVRHGADNVHRPDGDCLQCHTVDRATLETEHPKARPQLAPGPESRCVTWHNDQGRSHHD